ncbi:FecR domain-containing protein [Mucilaginibacter sp. ZT4R22]|uniref:FecR domain-containing protein n=1 Tax=Mucilaginibacter pankratovii TaxID=2772110 RepID=A0ABR7WLF9_9SPHI|nr:FecR family protein [Mucilaginibacter pankratovii]MBD1363161.1 FecR domain-containing protein [Mucilaginibacter pankratovii]
MDELRQTYLIKKYIDGTATQAEREELLLWYRQKGIDDNSWPYLSELDEAEAKERIFKGVKRQVSDTPSARGRTGTLFYKIAVAASVIGAVCCFVLWRFAQKEVAPALITISTRAGETKTLQLTDGSVIWLSAKSTLTYPASFKGPTRDVAFSGEAFFDIAKDKQHPFIVSTGSTSTRVLGTSFNISALKENDNVTVALITGKVSFTGSKTAVSLLPNNQVVYNKATKEARVMPIADIDAVVGRHNGYYEYKNIPSKDVAEDLGRLYGMNIKVVGNVQNCTFYGRIKPGESPVKFLKKMAFVLNASVTTKDSVWIIKGGGCNLK